MIDTHSVEELVGILQRKYPGWSGFDHEEFSNDEIAYKQATIRKAAEPLAEDRLRSLATQGRFDEIVESIARIGKDNNLLYLAHPSTGDLRVLYDSNLDRGAFCDAFLDLLYGPGDGPERLDRYVDFVESAKLPNQWTFPTYFLFVCHPDTELFVKPRVTRDFLKLVGQSDALSAKPTGASYRKLLGVLAELREQLAEYGPRDMVDIQSVVWVCGKAAGKDEGADGDPSEPLTIEGFLQKYGGAERLELRKAKEDAARALLESRAAELNAYDLASLLSLIDADLTNGRERAGRFGSAFIGNNRKKILESSNEVVEILRRFATVTDAEALSVIGDLWARKIPGAGLLFGSALLHVRDPEKFTFWSATLHKGLRKLVEFSGSPKVARAIPNYLEFNEAAQRYGIENSVPPVAMDLVLSGADEIVGATLEDESGVSTGAPVFGDAAFDLLAGLANDPSKAFYDAHKEEFKGLVEGPFKDLMHHVAERLPRQVREHMETANGVFARILKNDFGQGGAWSYYWGAFYPKGSKRIYDAQLYVTIRGERLEYGFDIGEYGEKQRERFASNCRTYAKALKEHLEGLGSTEQLQFGTPQSATPNVGGSVLVFDEWVTDPIGHGPRVTIRIQRQDVVPLSFVDLAGRIARTFGALFPLVIATSEGDPQKLLLDDEESEINPEISLLHVANTLGMDEETLKRWVQSIERKGQAVFYGPPGTGKTYAAMEIAKHLVGGGYGLIELVQFHPSYAYEDFIQGIRPRTRQDGSLEYRTEPGRFVDFCSRAGKLEGTSVLIVDEINRAKLSSVFGELMYLLEYRDKDIPLAGGNRFHIPSNVRIIGSMNTADRSVALVDHALRRRFAFIGIYPTYDTLRKYLEERGFAADGLIGVLEELNAAIGDRNYSVGISYFLREDLEDDIEDIWCTEIEPYIEEYFFDQPGTVEEFRWDRVTAKIQS